jgi:hypothetical protein
MTKWLTALTCLLALHGVACFGGDESEPKPFDSSEGAQANVNRMPKRSPGNGNRPVETTYGTALPVKPAPAPTTTTSAPAPAPAPEKEPEPELPAPGPPSSVSIQGGGNAGGFELLGADALECSTTGAATSFTFKNLSNAPVELVWIDENCRQVSYADVGPNGTLGQQTYAGHRWRVQTMDGAVVRDFVFRAAGAYEVTVR